MPETNRRNPSETAFKSIARNVELPGINWDQALRNAPDVFARSKWDELAAEFGLPFKKTYMQNLDSAGKGPIKHLFRNHVFYLKAEVIDWLHEIGTPQAKRPPKVKSTRKESRDDHTAPDEPAITRTRDEITPSRSNRRGGRDE